MAASVCAGFRCLDRDECYSYDHELKRVAFAHDGGSCGAAQSDERRRFQYRTRDGELTTICAEKAQELMGCEYTSKLLFQRTHMLRNYAFWGFSDSVVEGFEQAAQAVSDMTIISPKVAIGHVDSLDHVEEQPLGLFATDDLARLEFLGEYTGVLKVHADGVNNFDPYGISYPSVYEGGDLYVSASEYGNVIRCINHSSRPNARFVPMVHGGILRIFCFTIAEIKAGEQIFVNYGSAYWKATGVVPVDF